jgi:ABC-type antimicrobial peptide transport system permease subunit
MLGVALVVFVFVASLMLADGLKKTLVATGSDENVIAIRRSSQTEVQSGVPREEANILRAMPEVETKPDGTPVVSNDVVVLISLPKRVNNEPANVVIRGVYPLALEMRLQVKIVEGRAWQTGTQEVVIGKSIQQRFQGCDVGGNMRFGSTDWKIVGVFDAGSTGFDSEVWGDVDIISPAFRRQGFSSVTMRLRPNADLEAMKTRIENDPRLTVEIKREKEYYADQSRTLSVFIYVLGTMVSVVFSFGAMIGAMITMYAAVSNRTAEVGTLRALGFRRRSVLSAFLVEAIFLSFLGGVIGVAASSLMSFVGVSTTNWDTFAELAFSFTISPPIVLQGLAFAVVMGLVGGFLPAVRASRLKIVDALRAE